MTTLTEFLLARIAEDEDVARAASTNPPEGWPAGDGHWGIATGLFWEDELVESRDGESFKIYAEGGHNGAQARHIATHDPSRVLADCAAKRRIVAHVVAAERYVARAERRLEREPGGREAEEDEWAAFQQHDAVTCIARHMACVYSDHPDFDPDWRQE